MDKPFLGGILVAVAVVVAGGALLIAPRMQSPRAKVATLAGQDTERARRLLHQFSDNQERIGVLLDALRTSGVNPQITPEDVQRLLEEEDGRVVVEEQDARLKEVLRAAAGRGDELETRFLQAAYGSKWQEHAEPSRVGLGNNVTQMSSALQRGLQERDRLLEENEKLLTESLTAVESALGRSVGDVSGSAEVEPNRLHGVVLYHLGEAQRRQADALRRTAASHLDRLVALGLEARALDQDKALPSTAGIEPRIVEAEKKRADAETALAAAQASAGEIESEIAGTKTRIASLRAETDAARGEMERMEEQGARLDHTGGFEQFARTFNELAARYRAGLSEIHRLESGSLRNARINATGDLLSGPYVPKDTSLPLTADPGLPGTEGRFAAAKLEVAAAENALAAATAEVERLTKMQANLRDRASAAEARLTQVAQAAVAAYAEFERNAAEAESAEEEAVGRYAKSIAAFMTAARTALEKTGEAEAAVSALSEDAKKRRAAAVVAEDTGMEQQLKVNAADAQIRLGSLHYRVWSEDVRIAKVLADLPASLGLREVSADAWTEKATAARTEGVEVLQKAYDSLQNTRGVLRGHWTLAAEAAAAANLLALFGEQQMEAVAVAAYEAVIAEQLDKPFVQAYAERLRLMKKP